MRTAWHKPAGAPHGPFTVHASVGAILLLLAACGGGGSSSPSAPTPAPPPPEPPAPTTFTVSGNLIAPPGQNLDGDTNDPINDVLGNDDPANPQLLSNPVTLGGYVNEAGSGAEGRSLEDGDPEDYFSVDLLAGQRINLLVADFRDADADLYLFDDNGDLVDFSIATGELEEVQVAEAGRYTVNVSVFSGATNYTLAIGVPLSPTEVSTAPSGNASIVPWQVIVQYEDDEAGAGEAAAPPAFLNRWDARQLSGGRRRGRLLGLNTHTQDLRALRQRLGRQMQRRQAFRDAHEAARWETLMAIKRIGGEPGVRRAEPNYRLRPLATVNDSAFSSQWHYPLINLPGAWDTTTGSAEVIVAVVDTGVLGGHPDLAGQFLAGYDFVRDASEAADGDGIDPDPEEDVSPDDPSAVNYHGSHVTGTVAARGNNGIGVAGVAYSSRIMPLRALGASGGTSYDVRQAIRFAAGLENDSGTVPDAPADIINLSIGGEGFSQISQDLYNELRGQGIIVVAAAGNEGSVSPSYPGAYDNVFSVSAVDLEQRITDYSNRGSSIDLAAPGGDGSRDVNGDGYPDGVLSTGANGGDFAYTFLSGTSMASPHVAGVFALMKAVNPAIDADTIEQLLLEGRLTDDRGDPGRDNLYGFGIINARRAVDAALVAGGEPSQLPPRLSASTGSLNFGTSRTTLDVSLGNSGGGDLTLDSVSADQPWVSITAESVDNNGLGRYRVSVNRDDLSPGVFEGRVLALSPANSVELRILVAVADASQAELGTLYLLLYDPGTDEVVQQQVLRNSIEGYRFTMESVSAGDYQFIAGTDLDNDLTICDAGEACGAFITVDQPLTITVDADREDIEFPIEYLVSLPASADAGNDAAVQIKTLQRGEADSE